MADRSGSIRALLAAALAALSLSGCGPDKSPAGPAGVSARPAAEKRPNVLLILVDHLGPEFSAYGDHAPSTPNLDRLAREGEVFTRAYAASGSDDAAYASILTSTYPQSIGMVHEWMSGRGWSVAPKQEVRGFPETLRAAGYHTFHIGPRTDPFEASSILWSDQTLGEVGEGAPDWPQIQIGQPFFGEIDLSSVAATEDVSQSKPGWFSGLFGAEHRKAQPIAVKPVDPASVQVPAYLPDAHSMRVALAERYEAIERLDAEIGQILARLDKLGLASSTDIIVTSRSGPALPRAERTLYESGVRIPLIVRRADGKGAGVVRRDIVSAVDIAPSILTRAGIKPFGWMEGRERFASSADPERYAYSYQGRIGNVKERTFAIRDGRYLYIHNLDFDWPLFSMARLGQARAAFVAVANENRRGARPGLPVPPPLSPSQRRVLSKDDRVEDEFYDLEKDPFQMVNLAQDDKSAGEAHRLMDALDAFMAAREDYSGLEQRDLQDRFRPAGVTPTTAAPTTVVRAGQLVLESATPGAAILWRRKDAPVWRLYTGPVPAQGEIEAKAARYGFNDSAVTRFSAKP
jgi:arylsulfatase A-like enzyme